MAETIEAKTIAYSTGLSCGPKLLPDAEFVRKEISIREVAMKLGLQIRGRSIQCWLEPGHRASLDVKHNRAKCFRCPAPAISNIDLVMISHRRGPGEALAWISERSTAIPKVRLRLTTSKWVLAHNIYQDYPKLKRPEACNQSIEHFVRAPAWNVLSRGARLLAVCLLARIPKDMLTLNSNYAEMQHWAGIANRNTLARALAELRAVGLFETSLTKTGGESSHGWFRCRTLIRLTWTSTTFQDFLRNTFRLPSK